MKYLPFTLVLFSFLSFAQEETLKRGKLEGISAILTRLDGILLGNMDNRGLTLRSGFRKNSSTGVLKKAISAELKNSICKSTVCENYEGDFAKSTNSDLAFAEKVEWLIDGPEAFRKREEMIKNAVSSVHIMVWGYYDDVTGRTFSNWLLEAQAKNPSLDIKLIVDGQIANTDHHWEELKRLQLKSAGKIQVLYWRTKKYRANGMHRKLMIVDNHHVIAGGINIGDYYSHMGESSKWRDTDVYFNGKQAGAAASNQFRTVWNEQLLENKKARKSFAKMDLLTVPSETSGIKIALTDHNPGHKTKKSDHNILSAIYQLISDAQDSIDIENAYFIFDEMLEPAIEDALNRGVKVRILTNSDISVDEPIVSVPIMKSALKAARMGAEVYLKQGSTLHSKFMIVDGKIAKIGSQNLHPRSQFYEGENTVTVFDESSARELTGHFEADLENAVKITDPDSIKIKSTFISKLVETLLFSHL